MKRPRHALLRNCGRLASLNRAAIQLNGSFIGRVDAGNQIEDRRLAGAVGSDQSIEVARIERHVQVFDRDESAESFRALADAENGHR